jgi:hypothetical protein
MPDPLTIGALAASTLAIVGDAALKGAVGEGVKDAYKAVKDRVAQWASSDVEALAKEPSSPARQAVIAEIVNQRPEHEQQSLKALVDNLLFYLKENDPAAGAKINALSQTINSGDGSTNLQAGRDAINNR